MTQQKLKDEDLKDKPYDQGGHDGLAGHGGQHSGGMGGEHGGDLHDVGSAQSGMTGGSGMGGNSRNRQADERLVKDVEKDADAAPEAEVQQSAQRQGMGNHRQGGRGDSTS